MKRENIKFIIGIIIGGIIFGSIGVYAVISAMAGNVRFNPTDNTWNVSNVSEALEDLYDLAGENTYGVRRRVDSESSAWERIGKSKGLVANAQVGESSVRNDFDAIYPWSDIKSYNYNTDTKSITAWFGEENFSLKPGGNVEVLTYIPEFYYLRYQKNGYEYILISKEERKDFTKSEAFSIGRYTMSVDPDNESRVHSKSGKNPLASKTITEFRTLAESLGDGFHQLDYHIFIIQLLYLVEYANYDSQLTLGSGVTGYSSDDTPIESGGCDKLGMHSGSVDGTDKTSMIYRGIEDIHGNIWQFVDGININNHEVYINYNANTYELNTFTGDYQKVGYINSRFNGSASIMGYDARNQLIALPIESTSITSSNIGDNYWQKGGSTFPLFGGIYFNTSLAGLFSWLCAGEPSLSDVGVSARLIKVN